jgi:hypothetical protein
VSAVSSESYPLLFLLPEDNLLERERERGGGRRLDNEVAGRERFVGLPAVVVEAAGERLASFLDLHGVAALGLAVGLAADRTAREEEREKR